MPQGGSLKKKQGIILQKIRFMFKAYQAASKISSTIYFYLAEELVKGEKNLDEGEILKSKFVSKDRFESMVRKGLINDQSAVAAYTYYKADFKKIDAEGVEPGNHFLMSTLISVSGTARLPSPFVTFFMFIAPFTSSAASPRSTFTTIS